MGGVSSQSSGSFFRTENEILFDNEVKYLRTEVIPVLVKIHDFTPQKYHKNIDLPTEKYTSHLYFLRLPQTHHLYMYLCPSRGSFLLNDSLICLETSLISVKSVSYSEKSLSLSFRPNNNDDNQDSTFIRSLHIEFQFQTQFIQVRQILLSIFQDVSQSSASSIKRKKRICSYIVPKKLQTIEKLKDFFSFGGTSSSSIKDHSKSNEETGLNERSDLIERETLQFYEIPATQWNSNHLEHFLSHIHLNINNSVFSFLKTEFPKVLENLFSYFEKKTYLDFLRDLNHFESKKEHQQEEEEIQFEERYKKLVPLFEKESIRKVLKRECYRLKDNHGIFNIHYFLVLKKLIKMMKNNNLGDWSLEDLQFFLNEKREFWEVESCRDYLLSLLLFETTIESYIGVKTTEFFDFEESQLKNENFLSSCYTLSNIQGHHPKTWTKPLLRLVTTDPDKWENILRSFCNKNKISLERLSFEVYVLQEINNLRKKKKQLVENHVSYKQHIIEKMRISKLLKEKQHIVKTSSNIIASIMLHENNNNNAENERMKKLNQVVIRTKGDLKRLLAKLEEFERLFSKSKELQKTYLLIQRLNEDIYELSRVLKKRKEKNLKKKKRRKRRKETFGDENSEDVRRKLKREFFGSQSRRDNIRHFLTQSVLRRLCDTRKDKFVEWKNLFFFVLVKWNNESVEHSEREEEEEGESDVVEEIGSFLKMKKIIMKESKKSSIKHARCYGFKFRNIGFFWDSDGLVRIENLAPKNCEILMSIPCSPPFFSDGMTHSQGKDREEEEEEFDEDFEEEESPVDFSPIKKKRKKKAPRTSSHDFVLEKVYILAEELIKMNLNFEFNSSTSQTRKLGKLTHDEFNERIFRAFDLPNFFPVSSSSSFSCYDFLSPLVRDFFLSTDQVIRRRREEKKKKTIKDENCYRYLELTKDLETLLLPILKFPFLPDTDSNRIYFRSHSELDQFFSAVLSICPDFSSNFHPQFQLLKSFDNSFWSNSQSPSFTQRICCPFKLVRKKPNKRTYRSTSRYIRFRSRYFTQISKDKILLKKLRTEIVSLRTEMLRKIRYIKLLLYPPSSSPFHQFPIRNKRSPSWNLRLYQVSLKIRTTRKDFDKLKKDSARFSRSMCLLGPKFFLIRILLRLEKRKLIQIKVEVLQFQMKFRKFCQFLVSMFKLKTKFVSIKKKFGAIKKSAVDLALIASGKSEWEELLKKIVVEFGKSSDRIREVERLRKVTEEMVYVECNKIDDPITSSSLNSLKKDCGTQTKLILDHRNSIVRSWSLVIPQNFGVEKHRILDVLTSHVSVFSRFCGYKEKAEGNPNLSYFGDMKITKRMKKSSSSSGSIVDYVPDGKGFLIIQAVSNFWGAQEFQAVFEGEFVEGKRTGRGLLLYHHSFPVPLSIPKSFSGKKQKMGNFRDGKLLYEGEFLDGKRNGKGVGYLPNGLTIEGIWKDDKLVTTIRSSKGDADQSDPNHAATATTMMYNFQIFDGKSNQEQFEPQFILSNIVGHGTYGSVYKVQYERKDYAAKIYHMDNMVMQNKSNRDPGGSKQRFSFVQFNQMLEKIRRSLRICASFQHPNLIRVYGMIDILEKSKKVVSIPNYPLPVRKRFVGVLMEYMRDGDVDQFIQRFKGKMSLNLKLRILYETASGMKYLHHRNITHRDLKWGNVLLNIDTKELSGSLDDSFPFSLKITDFDSLREDESSWRLRARNHTINVAGTAEFLAPESFTGHYSLAVDVFSFGMMIFCFLFETTRPYENLSRCPKCGEKISSFGPQQHQAASLAQFSIPFHVKRCNLRPRVRRKKKMEEDENYGYLIRLMKQCWSRDPKKRPTFVTIWKILDLCLSKDKKKNQKKIEEEEDEEDDEFVVVKRKTLEEKKGKNESQLSGIFKKMEEEAVGEEEEEESFFCGTEKCKKEMERLRKLVKILSEKVNLLQLENDKLKHKK